VREDKRHLLGLVREWLDTEPRELAGAAKLLERMYAAYSCDVDGNDKYAAAIAAGLSPPNRNGTPEEIAAAIANVRAKIARESSI
jgi:hypothetical protein